MSRKQSDDYKERRADGERSSRTRFVVMVILLLILLGAGYLIYEVYQSFSGVWDVGD